jgi:hypothetical protein
MILAGWDIKMITKMFYVGFDSNRYEIGEKRKRYKNNMKLVILIVCEQIVREQLAGLSPDSNFQWVTYLEGQRSLNTFQLVPSLYNK